MILIKKKYFYSKFKTKNIFPKIYENLNLFNKILNFDAQKTLLKTTLCSNAETA